MIRKSLILAALLFIGIAASHAQSTMTDEDVAAYMMSEVGKGSSETKIVTDLFQKGVTSAQISRARKLLTAQKDGSVSSTEVSRSRVTKQHSENFSSNQNDYQEVNESALQETSDLDNIEKISTEMAMGKHVFGHDIFNKQNLTFAPNMNMATPLNYTLGPGDQVIIDIWGASQKTINSTISPEGVIVVNQVGPIALAGLTVDAAKSTIKSKLGQYYAGCNFNLSVGTMRSIQIEVVGEVNAPGSYAISGLSTAFNALYVAGGIKEKGTLRNIKVYRNNRVLAVVDVYDFLINGNTSSDVRLQDKDLIVVGTYESLVKIDGQVKRPMYYEMRKNESAKQLINFAGGFANEAYTKNVKLTRKTGSEYSIHTIEEFDLGGFTLSDGDEVHIDGINSRYSNLVEVRGAVKHPGQFQLGSKIQSVRELLEAADGLREDAYVDRAIMHREKEDLSLEMISIDIKGIVDGTAPDVALKNNDLLFIPSKTEMRGNWAYTITGEVTYPGTYPFAENTTLQDIILQAGGVTTAASLVNVDVYRRIIDNKATSINNKRAEHFTFALDEYFNLQQDTTFYLKPHDEVVIRKSPSYDLQQSLYVKGCVNFPGTYIMTKRDYRLSDLVKDAGGFTSLAYTPGAHLTRHLTVDEKKQRDNAYRKAQVELYEQSLDEDKNMSFERADSLLSLKMSLDDTYSVAINLEDALKNPGGPNDIVLLRGDLLNIPQYSNIVKIMGEVNYPISINYKKGEKLKYYINRAGGFAEKAKKNSIYIVYANGSVKKAEKGSTKDVQPGCEIVIPTKVEHEKRTPQETMAIASGTASLTAIVIAITNLLK